MSEKSHVSMEQKICLVTGLPFDSGAILLDKRMRASMKRNTVTGWGISPEVQEKIDEGYIALVGIDISKSIVKNERIQPEEAYRTGNIAYLRRSVLQTLMPGTQAVDWTFVEDSFIDKLEKMQREEEGEEEGEEQK